MARPQEWRIGEHKLVRDGAGGEQALRTVEIGEQRLEQSRTLDQRALEPAPFVGGDEKRNKIDAPGLCRTGGIGVDIVSDADLAHTRIELLHAQRPRGRVERGRRLQEGLPVRLEAARAGDQLVEAMRQRGVALGQVAVGPRCCFSTRYHRAILHPSGRKARPGQRIESNVARPAACTARRPGTWAPSRTIIVARMTRHAHPSSCVNRTRLMARAADRA